MKHSFTDNNGKRWVACCECGRGGNGIDAFSCASGFQIKKWNKMGCFLGREIISSSKPFSKDDLMFAFEEAANCLEISEFGGENAKSQEAAYAEAARTIRKLANKINKED